MECTVVNTKDVDEFILHTNPIKKEISQYFLIRYMLDRAMSADEAIEIMKNIDIVDTLPYILGVQASQYELHFLIYDKNKSYVVEFYNKKNDGEKIIVIPNEQISIYILPIFRERFIPIILKGIECYRKLKDNMNSVDSMKKSCNQSIISTQTYLTANMILEKILIIYIQIFRGIFQARQSDALQQLQKTSSRNNC